MKSVHVKYADFEAARAASCSPLSTCCRRLGPTNSMAAGCLHNQIWALTTAEWTKHSMVTAAGASTPCAWVSHMAVPLCADQLPTIRGHGQRMPPGSLQVVHTYTGVCLVNCCLPPGCRESLHGLPAHRLHKLFPGERLLPCSHSAPCSPTRCKAWCSMGLCHIQQKRQEATPLAASGDLHRQANYPAAAAQNLACLP